MRISKRAKIWLAVLFVVAVIALSVGLGVGLTSGSGSGDNERAISQQPKSTIQLVNKTSQNPLEISMQISQTDTSDLWVKRAGKGTISSPFRNTTKNPSDYQLVSLGPNEVIVLDFVKFKPFRVTPFSKDSSIMPLLIECGKDVVCDMSAVDGVNYLMTMELTTAPNGEVTTIDFSNNPCPTSNGCNTPTKFGEFLPGTAWDDPSPCFAGTCNLTGASLKYCNDIHKGQCANSSDTWIKGNRASKCEENNEYTTYCYDHDDTNSSPTLGGDHKVKATYYDL